MAIFLSKRELEQTEPADKAAFRSPVPTQMISNGEFNPIPQTLQQRQVEARIKELADATAGKLGLSRRRFLRTGSGMAAAFLAMNDVYGRIFDVSSAEAAEPAAAAERAKGLDKQFIVDVQTHFVRDDYKGEFMLDIAKYAAQNWNPAMTKDPGGLTLDRYKFDNFLKEIYFDSDTKVALLSGAPFDDPAGWFLNNDQIKWANQSVNKVAGSNRLLFHSLVTPKQPGWMEEVDRCIAEIKPTSWKGYTIGDPLNPKTTKYPWRLDDEALVYPFYEKAAKAGINTICIHKGLMPRDYEASIPGGGWKYATVEDLPKGHCHGNRVGRAAYRIGCRDGSALLPPSSLPARANPTRHLAVSPLHPELSRRRGTAGRTRVRYLLRNGAALGAEIRTGDRATATPVSSAAEQSLASRRECAANARPAMGVRSCIEDEGRPLEAGRQGQASNYRKLRR